MVGRKWSGPYNPVSTASVEYCFSAMKIKKKKKQPGTTLKYLLKIAVEGPYSLSDNDLEDTGAN